MTAIGDGSKDPHRTSGAPYPPATEHSDGPTDRPRHDVPTAEDTDDDADNEADEEEGR
jgi:hypothetical protein